MVHTAACSQLGRMLIRLLSKEGIDIINIVRRQEQVDILKNEEKAKYVLNSSDADFDDQLREITHKLKTKICFEAIGGKIVGRILKSMPDGSVVEVYGGLSQEEVGGIAIKDIVFHKKVVKGFILGDWFAAKGQIALLPVIMKVRNLIKDNLKSVIAK